MPSIVNLNFTLEAVAALLRQKESRLTNYVIWQIGHHSTIEETQTSKLTTYHLFLYMITLKRLAANWQISSAVMEYKKYLNRWTCMMVQQKGDISKMSQQ